MEKSYRIGAIAVIFAVLLRLACSSLPQKAAAALSEPEAARLILFAETGRWVELPRQQTDHQFESAVPIWPSAPEPLRLDADDAQSVQLQNVADKAVDIPALLKKPLDWDLTGDEPSVLILHSHTTESYTQTDGDRYEETSSYRTLDPGHNMLCLGQIVADVLTEAGIGVIHDTSLHDYPSYSDSYSQAAATTKEYLEQYPSIRLILDLHRDAAETASGQMSTSCSVGGQDAAQLMFVVGTDTRLNHPDWEKNLALALKLQVLLEQKNPGICRDLNLSRNRYNQHLGDTALLIEIGAAGNTLSQAKLAAQALGEAIAQLAKGTA